MSVKPGDVAIAMAGAIKRHLPQQHNTTFTDINAWRYFYIFAINPDLMMRTLYISTLLLLTTLWLHAQTGRVIPAEYEPMEGTLLTWDYNSERDSITANMARTLAQAGKVWIIYYPGEAPQDTNQIRSYLINHQVPTQGVYLIPAYTETLWIRDYGPFTGYGFFEGKGFERYITDAGYGTYNRPKDDSIPMQLANLWNMPHTIMPLQLEGGNVMTDGQRRGFAGKRILEQNPTYSPQNIEEILCDYMGVEEFMLIDRLQHSGGGFWNHIDMFMKIIDPETIMVGRLPETSPDYALLETIANMLGELNSMYGRRYKIIRIAMPPRADGTWATIQDAEMRTYTNAVIINNTVTIPSYNLPDYDAAARQIYHIAMPGYHIRSVDAQMLTLHWGALHCITKEVPRSQWGRIIHAKISGLQSFEPTFTITAGYTGQNTLDSMLLYYKTNSQPNFTRKQFYLTCPQNVATLNNPMPNDTIHYYIEAWASGTKTIDPPSAPQGFFSFRLDKSWGSNPLHFSAEVYPNPMQQNLHINLPQNIPHHIILINSMAQTVWQTTTTNRRNHLTLPTLPSGIYTLLIKNQHAQYTQKLMIIS